MPVKVIINSDEAYPLFSIEEFDHLSNGEPVNIPKRLFERYTKIKKKFDAVQDELAKLAKW